MAAPKTLDHPPFPRLTWEYYFWTAKDNLPAWAGFQERHGPYASANSEKPSTGDIKIFIKPPKTTEASFGPPAPEQSTAYNFLKQNNRDIAMAALEAIFEKYPEWQDSYGYEDDEREEFMPDIRSPNDLKQLIGLGTVHILNIAKDGHAYHGLEFGCTWDEEHGVGVLLHKDRVIKVGDASQAFEEWPARHDGGKEIE